MQRAFPATVPSIRCPPMPFVPPACHSQDVEPPKKILPCNDPNRPEWGILSDLLGEKVAPDPGMEAESAALRLKQSLFEAFGKDPPGFVTKMLHRKGDDRSIFTLLQREAATYPGGWPAMQEEIAARLVAPWDGKDFVITDADRGSSYNGLGYWDPEQGGLVTYIRSRIKWILCDIYRDRMAQGRFVSADALQALGIDIDDKGALKRSPMEIDRGEWENHGNLVTEALRHATANVIAVVGRSRSEYDLFGRMIGCYQAPADSPDARVKQLRHLAVKAHEVLLQHKEQDKEEQKRWRELSPEQKRLEIEANETLKKLFRSWDPAAYSFEETFPLSSKEFIAFAERKSPVLRPADPPIPLAEFVAVERIALQPSGSRVLVAFARAAERFWSARITSDADLSDPERPDYEYLAFVAGRESEPAPTPPKLYAAISDMAKGWAELALKSMPNRFAGSVTAFRRAISQYDPAKDGFLSEYLRDSEVWKDPSAPCPLPEMTLMQQELFGELSPGQEFEPTPS